MSYLIDRIEVHARAQAEAEVEIRCHFMENNVSNKVVTRDITIGKLQRKLKSL